MTLLDLVNLVKLKFKTMLTVSVLCGLVVFAGSFAVVHNVYQATSSMVVNTGVTVAKGYADSAAASSGYSGVTVSATTTTTNNSVTITAKGGNAGDCVDAVNAAMAETDRLIQENLGDSDVATSVSWASTAKDVTPKRYLFGIVAFLIVLFAFIAWFVFQDSRKRWIHSWENAEETLGIPCVGELGGTAADRERLLAATQLVGRDERNAASSICFVPVGQVDTAAKAVSQLHSSCRDSALKIFATKPLSAGANALLSAYDANKVLLAIQQEHSTFIDAEALVHELKVVGIEPAGFVYEALAGAKTNERLHGVGQSRKRGKTHSDSSRRQA